MSWDIVSSIKLWPTLTGGQPTRMANFTDFAVVYSTLQSVLIPFDAG